VIHLAEVIHLSNFGAEICRLIRCGAHNVYLFVGGLTWKNLDVDSARLVWPREARKDAAPLVLILAFCHFALFGGWP